MFIYILYKTVRIETGEYYIGVHGIDTDKYPRFNDPYLGSGIRMKASEKKHGKKAFVRSILEISESRDVVLALEADMVTVEMIADPLCLNLVPGGRAGVKGIQRSAETRKKLSDAKTGIPQPKVSAALKGVPRGPMSNIQRQKISSAMKGRTSPTKGIPKTAESRQRQSDATKGVPKGPFSADHRRAISDAQKRVPKKECPHCHKLFDPTNYARWHDDKCKSNPNRRK